MTKLFAYYFLSPILIGRHPHPSLEGAVEMGDVIDVLNIATVIHIFRIKNPTDFLLVFLLQLIIFRMQKYEKSLIRHVTISRIYLPILLFYYLLQPNLTFGNGAVK